MGKVFWISFFLVAFGFYLYKNIIYSDPPNNCFIIILPYFMPSNTNTVDIIKLLKRTDFDEYKLVCQNVKTISKSISCGGLDGGCFQFNNPNKIYVGNDQGNIAIAAAILVHETCHAIQASERQPINENECYKKSGDYLNKVIVYPSDPL